MSTTAKPGHAPEEHECCKTHGQTPEWYQQPFFWILSAGGSLVAASFFVPLLEPFRAALWEYVRSIGLAVAGGFLLGGVMDRFIPSSYISKHLSQAGKQTVLYAVGLGFLMSSCCHGLLAVAMELHRKGASGAAIVSFLLASPWASMPVTFMLLGLFGLKGLLIVLVALLVALTTGFFFQWLDRRGWIERNRHTVAVHETFSIRQDLKRRLKDYRFSWRRLVLDLTAILRGSAALARMVIGWIFLGLVLAALSRAFIPKEWFHRFLGPSFTGLLGTLFFATVLEVCSEGTSPVAFEIYRQTHAFGNALAFLMAGVVTDYTEIGLLWQNVGRKTALWMLIATLPQVILWSWLFNTLHL